MARRTGILGGVNARNGKIEKSAPSTNSSKYVAANHSSSAWRQGAAKRERKRARSSRTFIPVRAFGFLGQSEQLEIPVDDLDNDPTYDESDLELIPRPIRRARRGRRRGSGVVIEIG